MRQTHRLLWRPPVCQRCGPSPTRGGFRGGWTQFYCVQPFAQLTLADSYSHWILPFTLDSGGSELDPRAAQIAAIATQVTPSCANAVEQADAINEQLSDAVERLPEGTGTDVTVEEIHLSRCVLTCFLGNGSLSLQCQSFF